MNTMTREMALHYAVACVEDGDTIDQAATAAANRYNLDRSVVLRDLTLFDVYSFLENQS